MPANRFTIAVTDGGAIPNRAAKAEVVTGSSRAAKEKIALSACSTAGVCAIRQHELPARWTLFAHTNVDVRAVYRGCVAPSQTATVGIGWGATLLAVSEPETYNPWTVVNLVFHHLAGEGLHPVLGGDGDPSVGARLLLEAFGIQPAPEGNRQVSLAMKQQLADIRAAMLGE